MALLASSILVTAVADKNAALQNRNQQIRAEQIAQKTAYKIEYVMANKDAKIELSYSTKLNTNYTVNISAGKIVVGVGNRTTGFRTFYDGPNHTLYTEKSYNISYNEGINFE